MYSDLVALFSCVGIVSSDSVEIVVLFVGSVCHNVGRLYAQTCGHFCFDLVGSCFHTRRKLNVLVSVSSPVGGLSVLMCGNGVFRFGGTVFFSLEERYVLLSGNPLSFWESSVCSHV